MAEYIASIYSEFFHCLAVALAIILGIISGVASIANWLGLSPEWGFAALSIVVVQVVVEIIRRCCKRRYHTLSDP
jgi:hypothetical protein